MMFSFAQFLFFFSFLLGIYCKDESSAVTTKPNEIQNTEESKNNLFGVASIAGIASRNGRVSSVTGVQFYPQIGAAAGLVNDEDGYIFLKSQTGIKNMYPTGLGIAPLPINIYKTHPPMQTLPIQLLSHFQRGKIIEPISPWFVNSMLTEVRKMNNDLPTWFSPNLYYSFGSH
ncbi:hypothetical protein ACJJTC_015602 [Scirpophaga incertulas]